MPDSLHFEPNRGQTSKQIRYVGRTQGTALLVDEKSISLRRGGVGVRLELDGSTGFADWRAEDKVSGTTSYILGNREENWIRDVPQFGRLVWDNAYRDISLVLRGSEERLEYDFVVSPGASPAKIRFHVTGNRRLSLDSGGNLVLGTAAGQIIQQKPFIYQLNPDGSRDTRRIEGSFRLLRGNRVGFKVGAYDHARTLVIDPVISVTLIGGSGDDRVVFGDPNSVIVGTTRSADFPGVESGVHRGSDIFVYSPALQRTIIIGGSGDDIVTCVKLINGPSNSVYIGGYTNSRDFPLAGRSLNGLPAYQTQSKYGGGDYDGFILVVYPAESGSLSVSTYLGGSGDDRVLGIDGSATAIAAVGSTTSTDFPLANAWQSANAGGVDGFVSVVSNGLIQISSYLGGSGDDKALTVNAWPAASFNSFVPWTDLYVGGITGSSDWNTPGTWTGTRSGPSDGFILHVAVNGTYFPTLQATGGRYFGGSGDDSVTTLTVMPNGNVSIAGTTSSTDLPFPGVPYGRNSGGLSDVFVGQLSGDLGKVLFGSYFGGTGEEAPLGIASNIFNETLVVGWTNSAAFPRAGTNSKACQPRQNQSSARCTQDGGPGCAPAEEGFLLHLDSLGQPILSTCFSVNSSNRIQSVRSDNDQKIFIAGSTNGPTAASTNGFYGTFSETVIHADGLKIGKDLSGLGFAVLGDPANHIGVPLTITSSDPSRVTLAVNTGDDGQASVVISKAGTTAGGSRSFRAYCLSDSGSVPLTLSAPGYEDRTIGVRCYPAVIPTGKAQLASLNASDSSIPISTQPFDPDAQLLLGPQNLRGGLAVTVSATSSNPSKVRTLDSVTLDAFSPLPSSFSGNPAIVFQIDGANEADLTLANNGGFPFYPSEVRHVSSVGAPLSLFIPRLARDTIGRVAVGFGITIPSRGLAVTLTSSDPSRARVTTSSAIPGQASITFTAFFSGEQNAYVEVLDTSAPVSITASVPGMNPVTLPISFGVLEATLGGSGTYAIGVGGMLYFNIQFSVAPTDFSSYVGIRPGILFPFAFQNSNPGAVGPASFTLLGQGSSQSFPFPIIPLTVQGKAPGTAVLSLIDNYGLNRTSGQVVVNVQSGGLVISPTTIGKNLSSYVPYTLYGRSVISTTVLTFTSSDPSRLLLSSDFSTPGKASISVMPGYNNGSFFAQALADSGTVTISATVDNVAAGQASMTLAPAGFAWAPSSQSIAAYVLTSDLSSMMVQPVRPGAAGSITFDNSNPNAAAPTQSSIPLSSFVSSNAFFDGVKVPFTVNKGGATTVSIIQPPGFVAPAGRLPFTFVAPRPAPAFSVSTISRDAQAGVSLGTTASQSPKPPITLTSTDPSKLLLSTNNFSAGSASIVVLPLGSGAYPNVYANALDGPGEVKVVSSGPDLDDASVVVPLQATSVAFSIPYGNPTSLSANSQSGAIQVPVRLQPDNTVLRPGAGPLQITINSSNPAVAIAKKAVINSLTNTATFDLTALSPGQTDLTIVQPPGFARLPESLATLHVTINGPSLTVPDLTLGQDLQVAAATQVKNGALPIPNDVDVTLTSSDPSRLLLSTIDSAAGSGTITLHAPRGTNGSLQFYLQALGNSGDVAVTISAPGYTDSTSKVTLAPTKFVADNNSLQVQLPSTTNRLQIRPVPALQNQSFYGNLNYQFRPGFAGVSVTVSAANGNITLTPSTLTFGPGSSTLILSVLGKTAGADSVVFNSPAPYVAPANIPVTVVGGTLSIFTGSLTLSQDTQTAVGFGSIPAAVTVTSSDPTRVLVASSPTVAGSATAVIGAAGSSPFVYVQGLVSSGSATLTFSAPGYTTASVSVALTQAQLVLSQTQSVSLSTISGPATLQARLSVGSSNSTAYTWRPGAPPLVAPITLSDPTIGTLNPALITFNAGDSAKSFTFRPTAVGSTILGLGVPSGFSDPGLQRQVLITVVGARTVLNSPATVGKDLSRTTNLLLSSPADQTLTLTLTSTDPSKLLLSNTASPGGSASISVTFSANSYGSSSFNLIGLASSGSVDVEISGAALATRSFSVALLPSGFVFSSSVPPLVTAGATLSVSVFTTTLNPQSLAPDTMLPLRPGISPATVIATSSNAAVLSDPSPVTFAAGDQQRTLFSFAKSVGTAILTLQQPAGFSASSNQMSITVQVR